MGQANSHQRPPPTIEALSARLTQTFATQCYTPIELYCFKTVFKTLADSSSELKYWPEATLCRFLELPDALLAGPVIFQLASYLGAFPFPGQAPAILTNDALLRALTVLTGRWAKCMKSGRGGRGKVVWRREIWRGCAVFDREAGSKEEKLEERSGNVESGATSAAPKGFAVDEPGEDDEDEDDDEDGLEFSAFELMDATEAFKHGEKAKILHAMVPSDNFLRLLQLLLLAAPITPQESLATYAVMLDEKKLKRLREIANCMLASFGIEQHPGIGYRSFERVASATMPYLFDSLQPLFEKFLFPVDDLHRRKPSSTSIAAELPPPKRLIPDPILDVEGDILDLSLLTQLSSFLGGNSLFRRLRPLYSGNTHGFSMGQFEKSVFNWRAPSILLVSGSLIPESPSSSHDRAYVETLPYKRFSSSIPASKDHQKGQNRRIVFGAYIPVPWKQSPKQNFGTNQTQLFQLSPMHDVFEASKMDESYVYFNKPPSTHTGLGFGSPLPSNTTSTASGHLVRRGSQISNLLPLGPISLHIDDALEFATFTHDSQGGGSFLPSRLPIRRGKDWQDRFSIEALEVWGCGGTEEAEEQRKAWAWEEREAESRRRINLGTGDIEADRELLKMAGLIGAGQSGGSMA
ncbi:restriction of telomere capping protein 5 [Venturia nashicola]|uniref:Restriction of telomere capping protein 5 n=1 Tax=Venturia nashicola TaxID=86259 RepID=A0A4Z1NFW6_9PEZI|nr:restriction of telomere capping protein 5 [Venturia nashicola]